MADITDAPERDEEEAEEAIQALDLLKSPKEVRADANDESANDTKRLKQRLTRLQKRVSRIETIAKVAIGVALAFGIGAGWLGKKIEGLSKDIDAAEVKTSILEKQLSKSSDSIAETVNAGKETLTQHAASRWDAISHQDNVVRGQERALLRWGSVPVDDWLMTKDAVAVNIEIDGVKNVVQVFASLECQTFPCGIDDVVGPTSPYRNDDGSFDVYLSSQLLDSKELAREAKKEKWFLNWMVLAH